MSARDLSVVGLPGERSSSGAQDYRAAVGAVAPGWHPDPSGRWQLRWWDGTSWTDHVANGGRVTSDPAPGGDAMADLVNRVLGTALGFAELEATQTTDVTDDTVVPALWGAAENRRDILVLAQGHLASFERDGTDPNRAAALHWLSTALAHPPPMTG